MKFSCLALLLLTRVFASDSSNKYSNSEETTTLGFSTLHTLEEIQQKAVEVIRAFVNSLKVVPKQPHCGDAIRDWILKTIMCARMAIDYLPIGIENIQKMQDLESGMGKLGESLQGNTECTCDEIEKWKPDIYESYIASCNQASKDIYEALQSINIAELSFERLVDFSKLFVGFSSEYVDKDDEITFVGTMKALKDRKNELDVLASGTDWSNIGQNYASYTQILINLLEGIINLAPEGMSPHTHSHVVRALVKVTSEYAKHSPNNENMRHQIKDIADKERKISKLYHTWKGMKDNQVERKSEENSNS